MGNKKMKKSQIFFLIAGILIVLPFIYASTYGSGIAGLVGATITLIFTLPVALIIAIVLIVLGYKYKKQNK